jgi:superfamily II DNA/RNA helicase
MNKFEQLGLSESLLKAILDLGFENPTEVQEKAILLLEKTQIWLRWLRGTEKTAAFDSIKNLQYTSINFISNTRTLFADYQRN